MDFFNDKIRLIRQKILLLLPLITPGTLEAGVGPDIHLDSFSPISIHELSIIISSSKPSTCLLDPIPTKLLKESLPLVSTSLLDMVNVSLLSGYVPQSFKVAVIKPLLKKASLDPEVLANYRPISNLPFLQNSGESSC